MKKLLVLLILALLTININCGGGGGGSATFKSGKTTVKINLGEIRTASQANGGFHTASSTIPSNVTSIRFTISAPDMTTITETVPVAGQTTITKTFDVPNGPNRHFLVEAIAEAINPPDNIIYKGETYANLDGTPVTLFIVMVSTDNTPPTFGGLVSATATSTTSIELSWSPATDNVTPQTNIQYLIFMSTSSGAQNFSSPNFTTSQGAASFTVLGLSPNTTYFFVVRAMDERGLIDSNTVEKSATTFAPPDTTPPSFSGLISATALGPTAILLSWNPATDNVTPSSEISYYVYMSTVSKGQNFSSPKDVVIGSTSATISSLTPGTTYYSIVRAADKSGNFENNTVEKSATTLLPLFVDLQPVNPSINSFNISFDVVNNGTVNAVNVTIYVESNDECVFFDCIPEVISVPAGGSQNVIVTFGFQPTKYRIYVDPTNSITESSERNNCISNNPTWCSFPPPASCTSP